VVKNKNLVEWGLDPHNYAHGMFLVCVGNEKIPVRNRLCPLCNTKSALKKLEEATDAQIIEMVHAEQVHGWHKKWGRQVIYGNIWYHVNCLRKNLGDEKYASAEKIEFD
jgi:hypothetical protein